MDHDKLRKHTEDLRKISTPSKDLLNKIQNNTELTKKVLDNNTLVDIYLYQYYVDANLVAGFLVCPKNINKRLPVVVYNRGGTEDFGLVKTVFLYSHLADIAQLGYVVIGSQYPGNSLSQGHDERGGKSDIDSILKLYNLIDALPYADTKRIGMYGFSRGGMMTYLCLKRVNWIKTAIILAGSADLDNERERRPEMNIVYEKAFGNKQNTLNARSAVKWADLLPKTVALLLLHGTGDDRVDPQDSIRISELLLQNGSPFELHLLDSRDHMLNDTSKERDRLIARWLDRYL